MLELARAIAETSQLHCCEDIAELLARDGIGAASNWMMQPLMWKLQPRWWGVATAKSGVASLLTPCTLRCGNAATAAMGVATAGGRTCNRRLAELHPTALSGEKLQPCDRELQLAIIEATTNGNRRSLDGGAATDDPRLGELQPEFFGGAARQRGDRGVVALSVTWRRRVRANG